MPSPEALEEPLGTGAATTATTVGIAGLGAALPAGTVPTEDVAARVGVAPDWITRRTGIESRYRLADGERVVDLGIAAAQRALTDAHISAQEVDTILVASCSADEVMPALAAQIAGELGLAGAMGWDVSLACTGWLAAVRTGDALITAGQAETVLVVAAESVSRITDHDDKKTAALFGDGAGAAVLRADGRMRLGPAALRMDAGDAFALVVDSRERKVRMDGPLVFQRAIAGMEGCCREVLETAGLTPADIDLVVPHQANQRITVALTERLGLRPEQVADTIAIHGNTAAASIPLALDHVGVPDSGRLLLTAFGSGFAAAAQLVEIT